MYEYYKNITNKRDCAKNSISGVFSMLPEAEILMYSRDVSI